MLTWTPATFQLAWSTPQPGPSSTCRFSKICPGRSSSCDDAHFLEKIAAGGKLNIVPGEKGLAGRVVNQR